MSKIGFAAKRNVFAVWCTGVLLGITGCNCSEGPGLARLTAELTLMPNHVDFGDVPLGASAHVTVTAINKGTDVLHVCLADSTAAECKMKTHLAPEDAPFSYTFNDPDMAKGNVWVVDKGGQRDFTVTFSPQTGGAATASLIIAHNGGNGPTTTLTLNGNGVPPMLTIMPDAIDFGQVTVGQRKSVDLSITNQTQFAQPVTLGPIMEATQIFGTNNNTQDTPANMPLMINAPGNATIAVKVWYVPPDTNMHANTLHVTYCPTCTKDIALSGSGIKPAFKVMPASLEFGSVDIGSNKTQMFTITNIGNVNLTVNRLGPDSGTSTDFSASPPGGTTLPAIVPPMATMTVQAVYTPHSGGEKMGNIEVDTNAWDDPSTPSNESIGFVAVHANGTGAAILALPMSINFGHVPLNGSAVTRNLVLQNSGTSPLMINSMQLNSPTPEISVSMMPMLPATVQPGASILATFAFLPTADGMKSAHAIIASSDRATPMLDVPLAGIGGTPNNCTIALAPSVMNFGLVERGRQITLPVVIHNGGSQPCSITNLHLMGASQFSLGAGVTPMFMIPGGGSHNVPVTFRPDSYMGFHTLLIFGSDDPDQAMVQVPIDGASGQTSLLIEPSTLDFGVVPTNCSSPNRSVTMYNVGSGPVTVSNVSLDPSTPSSFVLQTYPVPTQIPSGASSAIKLHYHPTMVGMETGVLFISHSAAPTPVAVPLAGDGENMPTVTDTFHQAATPQVDILMVIDNSGSMQWAQQSLATNVPAFLQFAQSQNIDYRIAVTTTDVDQGLPPFQPPGARGRFVGNPKIITPQTPNGAGALGNNANLGTMGSGEERGLEAAYLALSDPLINTDNTGFIRPDAALAVIVVSDDDDTRIDDPNNPEGAGAELFPEARPVDFYVNFFRNIKGFQNQSMFSFNAVVEMAPMACVGTNDMAEAQGWRYMQVAMQTGGTVESICASDWGSTLTNIGANSFGLRRQFPLSSAPIPGSINVTVNGQPSSGSNWSYDGNSNSVLFGAGSTPPAAATITVTYQVACN
jgi:hypothetical protein